MIDRDLLIQRAMENLSGDDLIIDSSIAGLIDHTLLRPEWILWCMCSAILGSACP